MEYIPLDVVTAATEELDVLTEKDVEEDAGKEVDEVEEDTAEEVAEEAVAKIKMLLKYNI